MSSASDVEHIRPYSCGDGSKGKEIADMFDNIAPAYDRMNRLMTFGLDRVWLRRTVSAVAAAPIIYFFLLNDDHRARLINMLDIDADIQGVGWQQYLGRIALANGGWTGQGLLNGELTSTGRVPEGHNDFIFVNKRVRRVKFVFKGFS